MRISTLIKAAIALCAVFAASLTSYAQEADSLSLSNRPSCLYPWSSHNYSEMMTLKPIVNWGNGGGGHEHLTTDFDSLLAWSRQLDNLTRGVPKLFVLVGYQQGGHDAQYPYLASVDPRLKRSQDATAQDSVNWFIREARKYHCVVTFHTEVLGAYPDSPIWAEYKDADLLSKNANGELIATGVWGGRTAYNVDLVQDWNKGYLQKRLAQLLDGVPALKESGVLYIDANVNFPGSPFHQHSHDDQVNAFKTMCAWLKLKYGIDAVCEYNYPAMYGYVAKGFTMPSSFGNYSPMSAPAYLVSGGRPNAGESVESRLTGENTQMEGDAPGREDWKHLATNPRLYEFYYYTLSYLYVNRLLRLDYSAAAQTLTFSDGVQRMIDKAGTVIMLRNGKVMQAGNDVFVPPVWRADREIIAYSDTGKARTWEFQDEWNGVKAVDIYRLTVDGPALIDKNHDVSSHEIALALQAKEAVVIVHAGADVNADAALVPAGQAQCLGEDTTTRGDWIGRYGSEGWSMVAGGQKLPPDISLSYIGATDRVIDNTSISRLALQNPYSPTERIAAVKTSPLHEIVDIMAPPDRTTEVALYVAKLDNGTHRTMVEAVDPVTQNVLASRLIDETISSDYVRFGIRGHLQLRVTKILGENGAETDSPIFSGVFFGRQASAPPPWSLSLDATDCSSGWSVAQVDRAVDGIPLSVGGIPYKKGVGTHAPSVWTTSLHGKAARFRALVGVQDNNTGGSVEFIVLGDGKVLFRSGIMRNHDKPKEIDVDLTGVQKLTLQVTDGGDGNNSDHADWIEPELTPLNAP